MTAATHMDVHQPSSGLAQRPVYDRKNMHPMDVEDRKRDNTSEGIDWDEIIATTQDDFLAGRFAFNSDDYPTMEAAMVAMKAMTGLILKEVLDGIAAESSLYAARSEGHRAVP
jgi:hypothetical protein